MEKTTLETIDITYYCNPKKNWSSTKPLKDGVEMVKRVNVAFDGSMYTMFFAEKGTGGPLISDSDRDKAMSKFMDALDMGFAVTNLMNYMR